MKTCSRCKVKKPLSEFVKHHKYPGGIFCYCKSCCVKLSANYRDKNREKVNEYGRRRYSHMRDIYKGKIQLWQIRTGSTGAVEVVRWAVRNQLLPKLSHVMIRCSDCPSRATQYDHRDYNFPLLVSPVCASCNIKRGPAIIRSSV